MTRRSVRPLCAPALAAAVALAVTACAPSTTSSSNSVSKFRGEQRLVAQTVEDLQAAATDSDEAKICRDLLARSLADRLARAGHGCPATVDGAVKDADTLDMTVESVRVNGDRATARVKLETGTKDRRATLALVREGGRWRIAQL
jgi:hypothetical protein